MGKVDLEKVEPSDENYNIMEKEREFESWYLTNMLKQSKNLVCYLEPP
jgi:hypothetical protein